MPASRPTAEDAVVSFRPRLAAAAAVTLAAGVVHVAAAVPHYGDDTLLGTAFMAMGWVQVVVAALLLRRRPARATVWAGVVTHLVAIGALLAARTVGLPIGHGGVEPVALPDATTAVLELVGLIVLLAWLRRPHRVVTSRPVVLGTLGLVGLLALGGSTVAVASLGTSGHGHAEDAPAAAAEPGTTPSGSDEDGADRNPGASSSDGHGHAPGEGH